MCQNNDHVVTSLRLPPPTTTTTHTHRCWKPEEALRLGLRSSVSAPRRHHFWVAGVHEGGGPLAAEAEGCLVR